jgi:hypothetical protein
VTTIKADKTAADRLLKTACREATAMIRDGHDPRAMLATATIAADLLLKGRDVEQVA